jgi:hypothetical protein
MPDQLSLFPPNEETEDILPFLDSDLNATDEMFLANRRFRNSVEYFDLLHFIAGFPRYSTFNGLLLYLQNPNVTYVATPGNWWRQFHRKPVYQAKPLIILAPMSPVRFVYDLHDTEGDPADPNRLKALQAKEPLTRDIFDKTVANCRVHSIQVVPFNSSQLESGSCYSLTFDIRDRFENEKFASWAKYFIAVSPDDAIEKQYADLATGLGHILCGHLGIDDKAWWQDRRDVDRTQGKIEAQSSAYLTCLRKNALKPTKRLLDPFSKIDCEMPVFGLNTILQATHYIEEMGKSKWTAPKKKSRYKTG